MRFRPGRMLVSAALALWGRIAAACPLCAENLSNDLYGRKPSDLGRGFFWSIILMIVLPFLLVATVAVRVALARRRRISAPVEADGPAPSARPA